LNIDTGREAESISKNTAVPAEGKGDEAAVSVAAMSAQNPLRILLAEDNIVNRKVAGKMTEKLGYRIECVENGAEAVEALKHRNFDVVLMDMQMPVMDGWDATRIIRSEVAEELQPYIIAMTASAMDSDRQKCFEAGMNAFVPKPIRLNELIGALNAARTGERYGNLS
jgi:CheY-like chemotaxis protein